MTESLRGVNSAASPSPPSSLKISAFLLLRLQLPESISRLKSRIQVDRDVNLQEHAGERHFGARLMITGLQDIYYNVADMNRSVKFYTEALGMRVQHQDEWWSSLDCCGINVGLHWSENQPIPSVPKDDHGAFAGATLTLRSNDIRNDRRTLEHYGASILSESNQAWGHMLVFEDPDGNILKLMCPKQTNRELN